MPTKLFIYSIDHMLQCSKLLIHRSIALQSRIMTLTTETKPAQRPSPELAMTYKNAIALLNTMQSPVSVLETIHKVRAIDPAINVNETARCLRRVGVDISALSSLRIIHVTGTKGKGSTGAMVEACLRRKGYSTGFFSSPHLVHVSERIRLNGEPINEALFTEYFCEVYTRLHGSFDSLTDPMPTYFKCLTVMALYVFLAERVDVAIVEVGVGGEYDCTNCIPSPWVTAVTTLDIDHTATLGGTLEAIAWQKAGIFKEGAMAVTSALQDAKALEVMRDRANDVHTKLLVVPSSLTSFPISPPISLGIEGDHQQLNASLALHIVDYWLRRRRDGDLSGYCIDGESTSLEGFEVDDDLRWALTNCRWAGRSHTLATHANLTYYLDGAHTPKSIEAATNWFTKAVEGATKSRNVLLFYCARERDAKPMFRRLFNAHNYSHVLMTSRNVHPITALNADQTNMMENATTQHSLLDGLHATFDEMLAEEGKENECMVATMSSTQQAIEFVEQLRSTDLEVHTRVLVTGSLHLVGAVLSCVEGEREA